MSNNTTRRLTGLIALLPIVLNVFHFGDGLSINCKPQNELIGIGFDYTRYPPKIYRQSDCSKICECDGGFKGDRMLQCYVIMQDGRRDKRTDLEEICAQEDQGNCVCEGWD